MIGSKVHYNSRETEATYAEHHWPTDSGQAGILYMREVGKRGGTQVLKALQEPGMIERIPYRAHKGYYYIMD